MEKLRFGIVGIGGRPKTFINAIEESGLAELVAACDIDEKAMEEPLEGRPNISRYSNYSEMLSNAGLDAVIIGTPMQFHASQACEALYKNINVYSEVTAALTVEECKDIVSAARSSKGRYMFGENCNYDRSNMIVKNMIKSGVFGEVYYAEGEYLHNCRELAERTTWRKTVQYINGVTYGTHNLGPILDWFEGDRITSVSCAGSGHHFSDAASKPYDQEATCVMLCKTAQNRLIKVRLDLQSPRPYGLNFTLSGVKASYEGKNETNKSARIYVEGKSKDWEPLDKYEEEYLPEDWKKYGDAASSEGHGGTDYVIMRDFCESLISGTEIPIDVHKGMDMTLPGIISRESIANGGAWMEVPNSREWL